MSSEEIEFPRERYRLGERRDLLSVSSLEANRAAIASLISQGSRSIHLLTRDLEPRLYGGNEVVASISRLVRSLPQAHAQILLHDSMSAVRQGHQLVSLAQRLSSWIEIRATHADHLQRADSFLVVDATGYLLRPVASAMEGRLCFHDPRRAHELLEQFREIWDKSTADPQLRRLSL